MQLALFELVVDKVSADLKVDRVTLYLVDHMKRELFSIVSQKNLKELRVKFGEGTAGQVAVSKHVINKTAEEMLHGDFKKLTD